MSVRNERETVLSSATCPGCHREWPITKKRQESLFPSSTTGRHSPLKPYQNECSALWSQRRKEGDNGFEDKTGRRHQPSANLQTFAPASSRSTADPSPLFTLPPPFTADVGQTDIDCFSWHRVSPAVPGNSTQSHLRNTDSTGNNSEKEREG